MKDNRISEPVLPRQRTLNLKQMAFKAVVLYGLIAAALFIPAGRLDWAAGCAFMGWYVAVTAGMALWLGRHNPGLLAERTHAVNMEVRRVEKVILASVHTGLLSLYAVTGLDAGRFGWSSMPPELRALGWLMAVAGVLLVFWVLRTNTFASVVVRLQRERGHHVVQDGPYRFVRHPMYLGILTLVPGMPLILGSWWAFIPAALLVLIFIYRTAQEDRYLNDHLEGYAEFSMHTRFRLLPKVW